MTTENNLIKDLIHFEGAVWISRLIETESRGNVYLKNQYTGKYLVLAYIAPSELKNREVKDVVRSIVVAQGLQKWLETIDESVITCSVCGLTLDESVVNITDYDLDLCFKCEN